MEAAGVLDATGSTGVEESRKETRKELRERENFECIGGLRAPWRSVSKVHKV